MKKLTRMIAIVLTLTLALGGLTGCGGKKEDAKAPAANNSGSGTSLYPDPVPDSSDSFLYTDDGAAQVARTLHDYSVVQNTNDEYGYLDGYLWLKGKDALGESHYVCVDKSGTATAILPASGYNLYPTGGGYAYYKSSDAWIVIDYTGAVHSTYTQDSDHIVHSYGDGYLAILNKPAGFNASEYSVTIYGSEGDVLQEISLPEMTNNHYGDNYFAYCGKGVFRLCVYSDVGDLVRSHFCFTESGNEVTFDGHRGDSVFADFTGENTFGVCYNASPEGVEITVFDTRGNTKTSFYEDYALYYSYSAAGQTFIGLYGVLWSVDENGTVYRNRQNKIRPHERCGAHGPVRGHHGIQGHPLRRAPCG